MQEGAAGAIILVVYPVAGSVILKYTSECAGSLVFKKDAGTCERKYEGICKR